MVHEYDENYRKIPLKIQLKHINYFGYDTLEIDIECKICILNNCFFLFSLVVVVVVVLSK
jgi:hypothetical protein